MDGIEMAYSTLCRGISALRHNGGAPAGRFQKHAERLTAAGKPGKSMGEDSEADPLRNLRRLSEARPGFEYSGTLPDDALFGSK